MVKTLFSLILCAGLSIGASAQVSTYTVGQTVDNFTVTDAHGVSHDLATIAASGKWIILDFFFTTCPPCISTVPYFSELHQKYGCNEGDLFCISIDYNDSNAEVLAFETTYATVGGFSPAPAVSGTEGGGNAVVTAFGIGAYPTYCLIGPDMKLKNADIWPVSSIVQFESAFTSSTFSPAVQNCLSSIDEAISSVNNLAVFPNPAVNEATVALNLDEDSKIDVQVVNLVGAVVATQSFHGQIGENKFSLDLTSLENGQYLIRINSEGGASVQSSLTVTR